TSCRSQWLFSLLVIVLLGTSVSFRQASFDMITPKTGRAYNDVFNANSELRRQQSRSTWLTSEAIEPGNSNSRRSSKVTNKLLTDASSYAKPHLNPSSGMLTDDSGRLNVRDTAVSAFVWAELGQISLAQKAIG